jgi:hypothetical protein
MRKDIDKTLTEISQDIVNLLLDNNNNSLEVEKVKGYLMDIFGYDANYEIHIHTEIPFEFEENYTLLRNLNEGDIFISKADTVSIYLKNLGKDKHLLKDYNSGNEYEVPHGRFPIFKKIG